MLSVNHLIGIYQKINKLKKEGSKEMNGNGIGDKDIRCKDCGGSFIFTEGEQGYFKSKQLSEPKRCPACRAKRKATLVPDQRQVNDEQ